MSEGDTYDVQLAISYEQYNILRRFFSDVEIAERIKSKLIDEAVYERNAFIESTWYSPQRRGLVAKHCEFQRDTAQDEESTYVFTLSWTENH